MTAKNNPLNYVSLGLLAMMFTLPFLINRHITPIPSFWFEVLAFGLGLAACFVLLGKSGWKPASFPLIALLPVGLMLVLAAQTFAGRAVYPHHTLLVALYLMWSVLLMLLGALLRQNLGMREVASVLSWALLAGGLACSTLVFLQMAQLNPLGWVMPPLKGFHGNTGQVNHLADYLGLALASALYLFANRKLSPGALAAGALVMLSALTMTGSRTSWIYLLLLAGLAWAGKKYCPGEAANRLWRGAWVLLPAFILLQILMPLLPIERLITPAEAVISKTAGPSIRLELLREGWTIFLAHPWLGTGWGQFSWQQFLLAWPNTPANYQGTVEHAHNVILQLLAETGLAGTLVLLTGVACWLWAGRKTPLTLERWWLLALLGIIGAHALLEYPLWYASFLGMVALLLGLGEQNIKRIPMTTGMWMVLLLMMLGGYLLGRTALDYATLENWVIRSAQGKLTPGQLKELHADVAELSRRSLLSPIALAVLERSLPANRDKLDQKLALNLAVLRYKPHADAAYKRALLLAIKGDMEQSLLQFRRAMQAFPLQAEKYNDFSVQVLKIAIKGDMSVLPLLMEIQKNKPKWEEKAPSLSDSP